MLAQTSQVYKSRNYYKMFSKYLHMYNIQVLNTIIGNTMFNLI